MTPQTTQRVPRIAGAVIALGVLLLVSSVIVALNVLQSIPNQKAMMTPAAVAGTPDFAPDVEARTAAANPARGQTLYTQYACNACHTLDGSYGAGPSFKGLGQRAATRRSNYSSAAYIYESIVDPNAFVVADYPASVMIQNFKAQIAQQDLYDLVAWLLKQ